jgi:MYXO-CTERM domain-containing protein
LPCSTLRPLSLATAAALVAGIPAAASAHFFLEEPESWQEQGALGDPQKTGPCGNEGPDRPTGAITAYRAGQTITIRINETIFHPGHYRIALATVDRSELPPDPPVTRGRTDCGSVPVMDPPVFPVLADGVLAHTSPFRGEQTIEVTLPEGITCERCTLQITQWMSDHAAPCFYYHCADLAITDVVVEDAGTPADDASTRDASAPSQDAARPTMDSGGVTRPDAGPSSGGSGCACTVGHVHDEGRVALAALALVLGALVRRRR